MISTNKRKLSKGQRESRTRKETGCREWGRAVRLLTRAKLELLGLPGRGGEEGSGGELPPTGKFPAAMGQGSP